METSSKILLGMAIGWIGGGIVANVIGHSVATDITNGKDISGGKVAACAAVTAVSGICGIGTIGLGIYKVAKAATSD